MEGVAEKGNAVESLSVVGYMEESTEGKGLVLNGTTLSKVDGGGKKTPFLGGKAMGGGSLHCVCRKTPEYGGVRSFHLLKSNKINLEVNKVSDVEH